MSSRQSSPSSVRSRPVVLAVLVLALFGGASRGAAQSPPKWPSSSQPRPLPAREVKFPPYELRTLDNGLQVVVLMHHEQPAVSLRLIVGAGGAQDPAGKPGVAALLTSVLDQGTTTKSAQQVADTIDFVGGKLETGIGRDLSWARVVVMKDSLPLAVSLLADVVRNPAFAADEVERQRKQTISALQVSQQDPDYVANEVFERLVYGSNPYGLPGNGTAESVAEITREDLVAFHRAYYAPNNCLLGVVGDVGVDEAMSLVNKAFGDWERRDVRRSKPADPPEPARRVIVIDKPDAVQTEVRVGHLGVPRTTADFTAVDLAIKILGGEGANRLHRVLRTERGLTYGVSAETQALKAGGMFVAKTNTRSDATGEVLRLIVDEYSKLRRERVGDEELSDAKAYLTGHFPLMIETPDEIATQVLNVLFYGLPLDELQTYRQRINAVGVDEVSRVAWKYVRPDRLAVVLVGNASAFTGQLRGVGFGKYEVVPLSDLDVSAADFRRKDATRATPGDDAAGTAAGAPRAHGPAVEEDHALDSSQQPPQAAAADPAQGLIARAIQAKGGLAKLESVKTVQATSTTTLMMPQGPVRTETTTYIQYPDHFRVEAHVAQGAVVQVYAGKDRVWVQDPVRGLINVPPQVRKDFKAGVDRDLVPLLLRVAHGELKARLIDEGSDQQVRAVEVSGGGIDPVTIYIDNATGLVLRESYRLPDGTGTAEELFTDYRDVSGLQVAFRATVRRNGLSVLERAVTEFIVNPPLKPGLFDPPSSATPKAPAPAPVPAPTPAAPKTEATVPPSREILPQKDAPPPSAVLSRAEPPAVPAPAAPPRAAAPAPATQPEALALLRKAVESMGGLEKLKAVKSMRTTATTTMMGPGGKAKADVVSYVQYPDRFRVDVNNSGHTAVALLVGDELTVKTPEGMVGPPLRGSEADRTFRGSVQREVVATLLRASLGNVRARLLVQDAALQNASPERLVEVSGAQLEPLVIGVDSTTGLVTRMSFPAPQDPNGPWVDEVYSDYRDVAGIKVAFRSETRRNAVVMRERIVKDVAINQPIDPALFDKSRLK